MSKNEFNTMVAINNLNYKNLGDPSLVQKRVSRKFPAKLSVYPGTSGSKIQFELSTGSSLVYGPNCYLMMDIKTDIVGRFGIATSSSTSGSAMNIFQSSLIKVNGKEIDRVDNLNLLSKYMMYYTTDSDMLHQSLGSVAGYSNGAGQDYSTSRKVIVPLRWVSGLFGNTEQLIPSGLINGATIDLGLESPAVAFTTPVVAPPVVPTYTVSNATIVLDMYELNDSASLFLKQEASKNVGLVFTYKSFSHQRTNANNITSLSANVGKPFSHVLHAFTVVREAGNIASAVADSFKSHNYSDVPASNFPSWRYLFGSMSFPECKVDCLEESYIIAQQTYNKLKDYNSPNSVSVAEYKTDVGILSQSFEKMGFLLEQSGMKLNVGGRSLYLDWTSTGNTRSLVLDTFMSYVKAISVFSDGRIVVVD